MFIVSKDAEIKLADTVGGLTDEATSWRSVYFRFNLMMEQYRSEYQIQIAVNLLNDLLLAHQGGVYICADRTIILLCRNVTKNQIDKAIFQLRYLFMDDPLAYDPNGDENPEFCEVYDLSVQYAEFYQLCRKKLSQNTRMEQTGAAPAMQSAKGKAFTPARLAHVEHDLSKADLSRVLRRQSICGVTPDYDVRKVFDEYYINISALRHMLHADTDFFSNRWLFRYLTQLLDERMLDLLGTAPARFFDAPVSLNLNIDTLLSRRFLDFDAALKAAVKMSIVIEIQVGEAFNYMDGFAQARDLLQRLGYKVCIDGLTTLNIVHINREALGFDLAKLQWSPALVTDVVSDEGQRVLRAIKSCGQNRLILCRCDNRQAVNYGQTMGINLFQGRFLDRVLNPNQKTEN